MSRMSIVMYETKQKNDSHNADYMFINLLHVKAKISSNKNGKNQETHLNDSLSGPANLHTYLPSKFGNLKFNNSFILFTNKLLLSELIILSTDLMLHILKKQNTSN